MKPITDPEARLEWFKVNKVELSYGYDAGGQYTDGTPCEWSSANCVPPGLKSSWVAEWL